MSGIIKFFHPEETFVYHLEKTFCKVVYLKKNNCLVLELESSDDLDHLEEDSLQNEFPKIVMNIDDFPIEVNNKSLLPGQSFSIPLSTIEVEDEDGELQDVYYTNLNVNEDDYELINNVLTFSKSDSGKLKLKWTGEVDDFTENTEDLIPFEVNCTLVNKKIEIAE